MADGALSGPRLIAASRVSTGATNCGIWTIRGI
jgi:hypothetical protein